MTIRPSADLVAEAHDPLMESLHGRHVTLEPLTQAHIHAFWASLSQTERALAFEFLQGPLLLSADDLWRLFVDEKFFFAVRLRSAILPTDEPTTKSAQPFRDTEAAIHGIVGYSPVHRAHRELELAVLLGPAMQRTCAATEAMYLLLANVCEPRSTDVDCKSPSYRRIVWKCDTLHKRSCSAALRLGFVKEATFRKHMIVSYQGSPKRSRDTDWFSLTDDDWHDGMRKAFEEWLDERNFDEAGIQRRRLEDIRKAVQAQMS